MISNATIQADKINFTGKTIINGKFIVDIDGNLILDNIIATNCNVSGELNAKILNLEMCTNSIDEAPNGAICIGNDIGILPELPEGTCRDIKWTIPLMTRVPLVYELTTVSENVSIAL